MDIPIENTIPNAVPTTKSALQELAKEAAIKHGLNASRFLAVIGCESQWDRFAKGDWTPGDGKFYHKNKAPPGSWPTSFGLAQFHNPIEYWGMTIEDAYDPEIAIERMAKAWENGRHRAWSCYKILYG